MRIPLWVLPLLLILWPSGRAGATWTTLGPEAAHVRTLAVAPSDPSIVYAGLDYVRSLGPLGVRKSLDGGETWLDISFADATGITALAVHPVDPKIVFAADNSNGIFRSRDGGASWKRISGARAVQALLIDPTSTQTMYMVRHAIEDGHHSTDVFLRSGDGGLRWSEFRVPGATRADGGSVHSLLAHPSRRGILFLGSNQGIYRSQNRGRDWELLSSEIQGYDLYADSEGISAGGDGRYWHSIDNGDSWQPSGDLPTTHPIDHLLRHPQMGGLVLASSNDHRLWLSDDGGATWRRIELIEPEDVRALAVAGPRLLVSVYSRGLLGSEDLGQTWQKINRGMGQSPIRALAVDPQDPDHLVVGYISGFEETRDGGRTWTAVDSGLNSGNSGYSVWPLHLTFDPQDSQILYAGVRDHGILKSTDGGTTWAAANEGLQIPFYEATSLDLAIDPSDPQVVWSTGYGGALFKSTDGAAHWALHNVGIPDRKHVYAIAVAPAGVFAGVDEEGVYRQRGDSHWRPFNDGLPSPLTILDLAVDPQNPQRVYAVGEEGAFFSDNEGTHWNPFDVEVDFGPFDAFLSLAVDPHNPLTLYLGSTKGLFRSFNQGETWHQIGRDGGTLSYRHLQFDNQVPPKLYAATEDGVLVLSSVACTDPESICFREGRFLVEVRWRDFDGRSGPALLAAPPTSDSALLHFFDPSNWEMLVKVLDGCQFNGHYWVFAASATNLETTVRVTDTISGEVNVYQNDLGANAPALTDTEAFACP